MQENKNDEGRRRYEKYWARQMADPEFRKVYEEEAAKKELWLQLVEARQQTGLTQAEVAKRLEVSRAQVARIEKRGYESYTLNTLRRYVQALGADVLPLATGRSRGKLTSRHRCCLDPAGPR